MNKYKYTNNEKTGALKYPDTYITNGGKGWNEYLEYVSGGGTTDPWQTDEEIFANTLSAKLNQLGNEENNRIDAVVGTSKSRKKDKIIARSVKLLRRETKGTATTKEKAELDALETLDNFIDDLETQHDAAKEWLSDPLRTVDEINAYDVVTDPGWSTLV